MVPRAEMDVEGRGWLRGGKCQRNREETDTWLDGGGGRGVVGGVDGDDGQVN